MEHAELIDQVRLLHKERKHQGAFDLLSKHLDGNKYKSVLYENHPIWWSDISTARCTLSRRSSLDAPFIRTTWANKEFLNSFHRYANPLPESDKDLEALLDKEYFSLVSLAKSLHWVIKDNQGTSWGVISITGISLVHKRGELLVGLVKGAPNGLSAAAMLTLFQFYFKAMNFNKLTALMFEENTGALKGAKHSGFKEEGRLKKHVFDPSSKTYVDLIQLGLLSQDALSEKNMNTMRRLFTQ